MSPERLRELAHKAAEPNPGGWEWEDEFLALAYRVAHEQRREDRDICERLPDGEHDVEDFLPDLPSEPLR